MDLSLPPSLPQPGPGVWEGKVSGRRGLAPGLPPGAALLTVFSLGYQPCPLPGPWPGLCLPWGSGPPGGLSFPGAALLAFCHEAGRPLCWAPREQMGRSGKAPPLVLRGLAPFFPPFVPLPGAACAQTTKAACLAASGGTGVTADSGTLGDGGGGSTLCAWESTERPGPGRTGSPELHPRGSVEALSHVGAWCKDEGTPRVVC